MSQSILEILNDAESLELATRFDSRQTAEQMNSELIQSLKGLTDETLQATLREMEWPLV